MAERDGIQYIFLPYHSFEDGTPQFGVVCKRTYQITNGEAASVDPAQLELFAADVYWEQSQPLLSSVRHESDHVPCKPKTDVVVNARAYAPGGRPVDQMTVAVEVEGIVRKEVLVLGDRFCIHRVGSSPQISAPLPFDEMPIRYEYAYGGIDSEAMPDGGLPYPRNTVGIGFAMGVQGGASSVDRMPLPNLEDPGDRLTPDRIIVPSDRITEWPSPAGFGWYGKSWIPRVLRAGIPEAHREHWEKFYDFNDMEKKDGAPGVFDLEFFNGASPGLVLEPLRGDERLKLEGLDPTGTVTFQLPGEVPQVSLDLGQGEQRVPLKLTTVAVLAEQHRLYLCWSGSLPFDDMEKLFDRGIGRFELAMNPIA